MTLPEARVVSEGLSSIFTESTKSTFVRNRPIAETQWGCKNWQLSYLNRTYRRVGNCSVVFDENCFYWVNWTNVVPVLACLFNWR